MNILLVSIYFYKLVILFFFYRNFCNNNVNNFFNGYVKCNFSTSKFLLSNSVAIFNIPDKNVSSSSIHFYQLSYSFYKYLFFINSVFYNIFNENRVINILNNDFYITNLFDMDNTLLFCNYKVTEECRNKFHKRKNKSNMSKISIR